MVVPQRSLGTVGSYTHPANYPAHHPDAGNAHPLAGQPDIMATAHGFYSEWARMIAKGMIKSVPKGMAYSANHPSPSRPRHSRRTPPRSHGYRTTYSDAPSSDDEERADMARDRINSRTVCGICGGIGHAGTVDGVGTCLTARLGNRIPHGDLARMTYPDGYNPPRFLHKPKPFKPSRPSPREAPRPHARAAEREQPVESSSDDEAAAQAHPRNNTRRTPRHASRKPYAHTRKPYKAHETSEVTDEKPSVSEPPQNSDRTAESSESDRADHHSRLAVAFEAVTFE